VKLRGVFFYFTTADMMYLMSNINTVNSSSFITSHPAAAAGVAMASTDALNAVPVTTALMVACEDEDVDEVRKLLSADEVRENNT